MPPWTGGSAKEAGMSCFHFGKKPGVYGTWAYLIEMTTIVSRFASFFDGEICCSSREPQQKALDSMNSTSLVFLCFPGVIRFQLLKEFLLADEMRPSSITEPQPEIEEIRLSVAALATVLRRSVQIEGSVASSFIWNFGFWCHLEHGVLPQTHLGPSKKVCKAITGCKFGGSQGGSAETIVKSYEQICWK